MQSFIEKRNNFMIWVKKDSALQKGYGWSTKLVPYEKKMKHQTCFFVHVAINTCVYFLKKTCVYSMKMYMSIFGAQTHTGLFFPIFVTLNKITYFIFPSAGSRLFECPMLDRLCHTWKKMEISVHQHIKKTWNLSEKIEVVSFVQKKFQVLHLCLIVLLLAS